MADLAFVTLSTVSVSHCQQCLKLYLTEKSARDTADERERSTAVLFFLNDPIHKDPCTLDSLIWMKTIRIPCYTGYTDLKGTKGSLQELQQMICVLAEH